MTAPDRPFTTRYELTPDGRACIDPWVSRLDDIYNRFDHAVVVPNRNLAPALVRYLEDCTTELGAAPFVIRFHLKEAATEREQTLAKVSLDRYFAYRIALERQARTRLIKRSIVLFAAGASLITAITLATVNQVGGDGLAISLTTQGLTVAAWLLLWESFGAWFLHWAPARGREAVLWRLRVAETVFLVEADEVEASETSEDRDG